MPALGENGPEMSGGAAMSDSDFIEQMLRKIEQACGKDFTAECVTQARAADSELDRLMRSVEQRPINND